MSFLNKYVLYAIGSVLAGLLCYGYVSTTQAEIKALKDSEAVYKQAAEQNLRVAKNNAEQYSLLLNQWRDEQQRVLELQKRIAEQKAVVIENEKKVVEYVHKLPDGFEKQCLNMSVPDAIGRLQ